MCLAIAGSVPRSALKIMGTKVTITMPVTSPGADAATAEQEHLHCAQLLFKHVPSMFDWTLKMSAPAPRVVTTINHDLLAKLPLLDSIAADFQALPIGSGVHRCLFYLIIRPIQYGARRMLRIYIRNVYPFSYLVFSSTALVIVGCDLL